MAMGYLIGMMAVVIMVDLKKGWLKVKANIAMGMVK